jgi:type II secretion system protein C
MKIRIKDSLWIINLAMSALLMLDVFLSDLRMYSILDQQLLLTEISQEGNIPLEPINLASEKMPQENIEPVSPPLELRGTIIGEPSLAFIYNSNADTHKVYKLNDTIDDFKIVSIIPAKVILARNGSTWELVLSGQATSSANYETVVMSRMEMISQLPRANELLSKIKIIPSADMDSHKLNGFRIDNIPTGSIIEKAGIKSGDIIHSVQGGVLENTQAAWKIFNNIRHQSQFEVVLLRGNIPITLRYEIRN